MPTPTTPQPTHTDRRVRQAKRWYLDPAHGTDRYLVSGLIAAVIFFIIDVATGGGVVSAIGLGVITGIVVVVISFVISHAVITNLRRRP